MHAYIYIDTSKYLKVSFFSLQHNFKKVRNNVEKSSSCGKRTLRIGGKYIYWSHWKEAYHGDQMSNSMPLHERLKEDHFNLTPSSRMRNGLAEDILDKRMLLLMMVNNNCSFFIHSICYSFFTSKIDNEGKIQLLCLSVNY